MPIRITCPSCSASLSLKDELAGRAVKCPKCGGVIPPAQPNAPAAPAPAAAPSPPPAPERSPFELPDEPEKPAKGGSKVTSVPAPRAKDDEEDDRPRKKRRDEEGEREDEPRQKARRDADDRPRKKRRDERDEDERDDRPNKRRRDEEEGDEDDRPSRGRKPAKKSNTGLILGIIAGVLLLCCGGGAGLGYYFFVKVKDKVQEELNPKNDKVTIANYRKIKPGMTRTEVEAILGSGKVATREKLIWVSNGAEITPKPNPITPVREEMWGTKFASGRVYYWQNEADAIFILFHPDSGSSARVQMMEFMSKTGENVMDPLLRDDADFIRAFPPKK